MAVKNLGYEPIISSHEQEKSTRFRVVTCVLADVEQISLINPPWSLQWIAYLPAHRRDLVHERAPKPIGDDI